MRYFAELVLVYEILFLTYFLLVNSGYTISVLYALALLRNSMNGAPSRQTLARMMSTGNARPVSILVPAFNEQANIRQTIDALLNLNYPESEVIIINDGSTDGTVAVLSEHYKFIEMARPIKLVLEHGRIKKLYRSSLFPNVWLVDKDNEGKAAALNAGINVASYPLYCAIDADSILECDALLRVGLKFLYDKELVASGGAVRVLNGSKVTDGRVVEIKAPRKFIECIQVAEYLRGFMAGRVIMDRAGSSLIISGAFGIFRKDIVIEMGGYRKTVGEDMDLVVRLHRHCVDNGIKYKVAFDPEPVCWTQVPSDIKSLLSQRNRWQRGLVDSLWHNREMFLNKKYGGVGLFGYPYFVFVEMAGPIIELIGYVSFVVLFFMHWISPLLATLFFAISVLWGSWLNVTSVILDNLIVQRYASLSDVAKTALYSGLEFFGYRQMLGIERFVATFQVYMPHWGNVKRVKLIEDKKI